MSNLVNSEFLPFDVFTAANLGDLQFFSTHISINERTEDGWSPLMYACSKGHTSVVNRLLTLGAKTTFSSLLIAVQSGDLASVKAVFQPSFVNLTDAKGWTALFHAIFLGREPTIKFLLSNGAHTNITDKSDLTPVDVARNAGLEYLIPLLKMEDTKTAKNDSNELIPIRMQKLIPKPRIDMQFNRTYTYSPNKNSHDKENTQQSFISPCKTPRKILQKQSVLSPVGKALLHARSNTAIEARSPARRLIPESSCKVQIGSQEAEEGKALLQPNAPHEKQSPARKLNSMSPCDVQIESQGLEDGYFNDQVYKFLKYLNLLKYWPIFQEEEVDFETMLTFEESNLTDLGIRLYGPRRKILVAIQQYKATNKNAMKFLDGNFNKIFN